MLILYVAAMFHLPGSVCNPACNTVKKEGKGKEIIKSILPASLSAFDCKKDSDLALLS